MGHERIVRTFILTLLGLAAFAVWRPSSPNPLEDVQSKETRFFIDKAHQAHRFGGVIYGDSRGLRGLSPEIISRHLAGQEIFNFSWNAGGMNDEMYEATEKLLDSAAADPFILLVPSPLSFIGAKRANSQYHEYLGKPWDQVMLYRHAPRLADMFQPISPSVIPRKILDVQPHQRIWQVFHRDGWIETDQEPWDDFADLGILRQRLEGNKVDPELIRDFMDQTAAWTARGVKVFSCMLPAYPPRVAMEDSMLEFDQAAFIAEFRRAGGTWLDLPATGFESYDGSHLTGPSARRASDLIGAALAAELGRTGAGS